MHYLFCRRNEIRQTAQDNILFLLQKAQELLDYIRSVSWLLFLQAYMNKYIGRTCEGVDQG